MDDRTKELRYFDENEEIPEGFTKIPDNLKNEAVKILSENDNQPVIITKTISNKLYYWNRHIKNKKKKSRLKNKLKKMSKKNNR